MPITTLAELRTKKEKTLSAFSGTGASGATIASGHLSNQLSNLEVPKVRSLLAMQSSVNTHIRRAGPGNPEALCARG
jgi:hypothetical protein